MEESVSDLEKYINADDGLDVLIRSALIHYQFETIHPFLDGNGRVGRLLIILFLMEKKALTTPAVQRLTDIGVLTQTSGKARNRIFSYTAYLDLLREGT
jgi:Fic family protein